MPHGVNGRHYGAFYYLDDGKGLYLAWRQPSQIYYKRNAWCLDTMTLREIQRRGVEFVGVSCGRGKRKLFYLTTLREFYESPYSFDHYGETPQRGIPLMRFLIHPHTTTKAIETAIKIK